MVLRGLFFMGGSAMIGSLVVNVTLSKWFVELRGRAIGIGRRSAFSIGGILSSRRRLPPSSTTSAGGPAGRSSQLVTAADHLPHRPALPPPAGGLRAQSRRAKRGGVTRRGRAEDRRADYRNSYTRREALRTPALYMITFAFGLAVIGIGGVILNAIPFLTDQDYSRATAARIVVILGFAAGFSKAFWGWLTEHFDARLCRGAWLRAVRIVDGPHRLRRGVGALRRSSASATCSGARAWARCSRHRR